MSKYVNEILKDLKDNPETFKCNYGQGVKKDNVKISGYGNTRMLSVIDVHINGKSIPTSYIDLWRLEVAVQRWYRAISLKGLMVK